MKFLGTLLTLALLAGLGVATRAPSSAGPPQGRITAKCATGFTADPAWYTAAQLNSALGVKYKCYRMVPPNTSNFFHPGYPFVCSDKFSAMLENSGADAPKVLDSGEARYFCISAGPH